MSFDIYYRNLANKLLNNSTPVYNNRTDTICHTILHQQTYYNSFPLLTIKKVNWQGAIAELLSYLKGYSSAADFRKLGTRTWDMNANQNQAWLDNPHRKGTDDMGRVYGVQLRDWTNSEGQHFDQLMKVVRNLSDGIDDRGEILTMWNPGEHHRGCLRPCMYEHHFSILDETLYLKSTQRSVDLGLGYPYNSIQSYALLHLMAQITGLKAGHVWHVMTNVHLYDNQVEAVKQYIHNKPLDPPKLVINPKIKSLQDLDTWVTTDDFYLNTTYDHHGTIKVPFTV